MKTSPPVLHSLSLLRQRHFNRLFAAVYAAAILCLLYHHVDTLLHAPSFTTFLLFVSDVILAYMWSTTQSFRMNPVRRQSFPENLGKVLDRREFPNIDIFICTADPYKEPPMDVVNTALSVMAYDYPSEKLSVYVSDDGGSELTAFAFMEVAKFGKVWLPFCRENDVMDRSPDVYFGSAYYSATANSIEIKTMYDNMKLKVEKVIERGNVSEEYISNEEERSIVNQFRAKEFTRQNHPSVIQVLLNSKNDVDSKRETMPNLVYVSREKSTSKAHHFKAGALNTLLRVSACMTNSPVVLTLDCDMYSNDPLTARRALCYFMDRLRKLNLGYIQFPQRYHGLNMNDIYASEHKRLFRLNPIGMDGLNGPNYVGTGCFFYRRVFFGGPSLYIKAEMEELSPEHIVKKSLNSQEVFNLAHHVAGCGYEDKSEWGYKIGFRYGSLVEDYYTGYRLKCEGWQSVFCDPTRPAFLGGVPISLNDVLCQNKRWAVGLLEVGFSKYSPLTFGIKSMGFFMGQAYAHFAFWPIWSFPITVYAFVPSLALLQGIPIFPKMHEPWFLLYSFLFLGAYGQDCIDFVRTGSTFQRWWSDQRMWLIRGLSSYLFGLTEYIAKQQLGMATHGFNVTSKVIDDEQNKMYDEGIFEFGTPSPMFVPLAVASILNTMAFLGRLLLFLKNRSLEGLFVQMFIAGFGVLNSWPFIEAMALRNDKGSMPSKITTSCVIFVGVSYGVISLAMSM